MKKRIEKVVEWIDSTNSFLTKGNWYVEIPTISSSSICVIDDNGDKSYWSKERFKAVTQREVLEFEGEASWHPDEIYAMNIVAWSKEFNSDIALKNYDFKVIATPKDKTYEEMSTEELIKLL